MALSCLVTLMERDPHPMLGPFPATRAHGQARACPRTPPVRVSWLALPLVNVLVLGWLRFPGLSVV